MSNHLIKLIIVNTLSIVAGILVSPFLLFYMIGILYERTYIFSFPCPYYAGGPFTDICFEPLPNLIMLSVLFLLVYILVRKILNRFYPVR